MERNDKRLIGLHVSNNSRGIRQKNDNLLFYNRFFKFLLFIIIIPFNTFDHLEPHTSHIAEQAAAPLPQQEELHNAGVLELQALDLQALVRFELALRNKQPIEQRTARE